MTSLQKVLAGVSGVAAIAIGVAVVVAVRTQGGASDAHVKAAPVASASVPAAEPARARLKMPAGGIDASKVIGQGRAEVEKLLGAGEKEADGKIRHQLAGDAYAQITYVKGKAVAIEVPSLGKVDWYTLSNSDQMRVVYWFNLDDISTRIGARAVLVRHGVDGGVAVYDRDHVNKLEGREPIVEPTEAELAAAAEQRERDLAANLLRGRVHLARLSAEMRRSGQDSYFEQGDTPTDVWYVGLCNEEITRDLAQRMGSSFRSFGFTRLRCSSYTVRL